MNNGVRGAYRAHLDEIRRVMTSGRLPAARSNAHRQYDAGRSRGCSRRGVSSHGCAWARLLKRGQRAR